MSIEFDFTKSLPKSHDTIVLTIDESLDPGPEALKIDERFDGLIQDIIARQKSFKGRAGQILSIPLPTSMVYANVLVIGLGDLTSEDIVRNLEESGAKMLKGLRDVHAQKVSLVTDLPEEYDGKNINISHEELIARVIAGLKLGAYRFGTYKSKDEGSEKSDYNQNGPDKITIKTQNPKSCRATCEKLAAETEGVKTARDLGHEPANNLHPESFAYFIQKELDPLGIKVTILDEKKLKKIGAESILAVGKGSIWPPCMVLMEWDNLKDEKTPPLALIGKGITFDTGGISLKPASGMQDMKMDMCGAASVVGAMKSLALRKSRSHVIAAVALAENMPSDKAYRPGDIVQTLAGKTVEVLNTDAEGRLVLVDTLTYIQQNYDPDVIIDLATLTGAMMVALGSSYAGAFVNDNALWSQLDEAGKQTGDKVWRMPLDEDYRKAMKSEIADLKNLGGRYGGACTAAAFLEHFIDDNRKWAHLDIAGVSWGKSNKATCPDGPTGHGVRLLSKYIENNFEA